MNPNFTGTMLEYRVWKFPSGELGLAITSFQRMQIAPMRIVGSVQSSDHIVELLLLVNALRVLSRREHIIRSSSIRPIQQVQYQQTI